MLGFRKRTRIRMTSGVSEVGTRFVHDTAQTGRRAAGTLGEAGLRLSRRDPYWPAQLSVLAALLMYLNLPNAVTVRPHWVIPTLEGALLAGLVGSTPWRTNEPSARRRMVSMVMMALVSASNIVSLGLLSHELLSGKAAHVGGHALILAGAEIWVTNVLIFAIWYWEFDRGGPQTRHRETTPPPDFLFVQMTEEWLGGPAWRGNFIDYLYTSFTNATAFSPTDTMPLTNRAKLLMGVQSAAALWTVGLVVARAVNILS